MLEFGKFKDIPATSNSGERHAMKGTCSKEVIFTVKDDRIHNVEFVGGCAGNAIGLSSLLEGMPLEEVSTRLANIPCGNRGTSCPAQLAEIIKNRAK